MLKFLMRSVRNLLINNVLPKTKKIIFAEEKLIFYGTKNFIYRQGDNSFFVARPIFLMRNLGSIAFKKENFPQLAEQFNNMAKPFIEPLQYAIDEELYIQQSLKTNPEAKIEFYLGITSIEGIIDYYEKAEIIEPYVSGTIKRNLERETSLSESRVFFI